MTKLTDEQIKKLQIDSKVMITDTETNTDMGVYIVVSKGLTMCELVKEDVYEKLKNGEKIEMKQGKEVITYIHDVTTQFSLYSYEGHEKVRFFNELISVLRENVELIHPQLKEHILQIATEITSSLFREIEVAIVLGRKDILCCEISGGIDGLSIEYDLLTRTFDISFPHEKQLTYNDAMKYIADNTKEFRVESVVMDDMIDNAIATEDALSMQEEICDTNEEFLNNFLQEENHSLMDILKFITLYGNSNDFKDLIENGIWIMVAKGLDENGE